MFFTPNLKHIRTVMIVLISPDREVSRCKDGRQSQSPLNIVAIGWDDLKGINNTLLGELSLEVSSF